MYKAINRVLIKKKEKNIFIMIPLILLNVLLIIISPIQSATPDAVVAISQAGMNKGVKMMPMNINEQFKKPFSFQDYSGTVGTIAYSIHDSTYYQNMINGSQIEVTLTDGQRAVQMKWSNLRGYAIMNIDYTITLTSGKATVLAGFNWAYALVSLDIQKDVDGKPKATETGNLVLTEDQIVLSFNGTDTSLIEGPAITIPLRIGVAGPSMELILV